MLYVPLMCVLKRCLLLLALVCCAVFARAQTPATEAVADASAVKVLRTVVLVSPAPKTLDAIQATPASEWQNFDSKTTYPLDEGAALWIKLRLSVNTPPTGWMLKLPKPFLDRVEVYLPNPDGVWRVQAAGDNVVHRDWPVRGLHPQFALPTLDPGEHTVLLKVSNRVPANFDVLVLSAQDANADSLGHYIRSSLVLIFLMSMVFISVALAVVYRDVAYAFYSVYVTLAALTVAAYTGLGNYLLWPSATHWPEISIHVSLLTSLMAQLAFCHASFAPQKLWAKLRPFVGLTAGLTAMVIAVLILSTDQRMRSASFFFALFINYLMIAAMVLPRLLWGERSAKLWLLAYLPLAGLVVLSSIDHFGVTGQSLVGYYWPIYALAFEVPVLMLALALRAKARDAQTTVKRVHQQLDPLTGFLMHHAYEAHALPLWERATSLDLDLVVVYVQITQPTRPSAILGGRSQAPGSERIVRVLRTVFRQEDVYAQLADDVYAILMPDKALSDPLQNRLVRLVAQIHMLSKELQTDYPLRTRIVACSSKSLPLPWLPVHQALLEKLSKEQGWDKRSIRYLATRNSPSDNSEPDLSDFWRQAVDASTSQNG